MKYDFTSILDRRGRDAIALDGIGLPGRPGAPRAGFDAIPMWVADMNFPTAPGIPAAIRERAGHPAFGYFSPTEDYYNAIIRWQGERNGVSGLSKEHIGYENGVLGGVVSALNVVCSRGDKVLIHSPTYIGFTGALGNNGYEIVHSPLVLDGGGVWRMDFAGMEKKIVDNRIHAAVFCSPHNPCGRVWAPAHPHPERQRGRQEPHRGPVRPLQDLQPGGAGGELPHHLQPLAPGAGGEGVLPVLL